jgi:hypothetical protein
MHPIVDSDSIFLPPAETRAARLVMMTAPQRHSAQK